MNRLAALSAVGALMFAAAPRVVVVDNTSATHWFRCAFSGSCIPQAAYELRKTESVRKAKTDAATQPAPAPKPTTTQPWIVNK